MSDETSPLAPPNSTESPVTEAPITEASLLEAPLSAISATEASTTETSAIDIPGERPSTSGASNDVTFIVMLVGSVTFHLPSPTPLLTLIEEQVPFRELIIPIGLSEAQSLALAIEGEPGARPSTHELFSSVLRESQTDIAAVRIVRCENGVYFAEIDLVSPRGHVVLDCRPTDAVIMSLRQGVHAPVLCDEQLL